MTCRSLHSICAGDWATRVGRTASLGIGVSPESTNSSTSKGTSAEEALAAGAISSLTTLMTNSPVSSTLRSGAFLLPASDVSAGGRVGSDEPGALRGCAVFFFFVATLGRFGGGGRGAEGRGGGRGPHAAEEAER